MNPRIAARMSAIEPFHVMEVMDRAHALEVLGRSIIHMEVGEPDFPTPQPILDAAAQALQGGSFPYTLALGLPALRAAIADFYRQHHGVTLAADRIIVTAGSSAALLLTMGVLLNPGEQVLMADPGYPCNRQFVRVMGGEPVGVAVGPDSAYQLTPELVDANWTANTAAVLIASPANPTGTMIDASVLRAIARLVAERGGQLIVDEIYQGLCYDVQPATALALAEHSDGVFVINSFSKYFDMTGWRLGWLVAPNDYLREIEKLAQNLFICPSTPAQYAALAAFTPETSAILEARRRELHARRDFLVPALRRMGFSIPLMPQGAFYVYAGCERFTSDSYQFALDILEQAGVAVTPGLDFGAHQPERNLRFAYTTSMEKLREGVRRLEDYLAQR